MFLREKVPITKNEVRVVALSKLRLKEDSLVLDVGCGTGTITVEAALQCPKGRVVAVDLKREAVELTKNNVKRFCLSNVEVLSGQAPEGLPGVMFDRIFIGGGGASLAAIISYAACHLTAQGIVVANAILLDSALGALKALEEHRFKDIECVCVNIARGEKTSGWMMKALNPVYIISGHI